jgi:hypothetical protein
LQRLPARSRSRAPAAQGARRMTAGYATQRSPRGFELLEVLSSIAAYQDSKFTGKGKRWGKAGAWCIVRQRVILAWYEALLKRFGRPDTICRRTLSYQVAGLKRRGFIHAHTQRHQRHRGGVRHGELDLRPSIYKFTSLGRLWIKRRMGWVENPIALSAVQKVAQSGLHDDLISPTSLSRAVDKSPPASGGKTRELRMRRRSSIARPAPRPRKAPVRKGAAKRARTAPVRRTPARRSRRPNPARRRRS